MALLFVLPMPGCRTRELLEQAKRQREAGELEQALGTVAQLQDEAPASGAAREGTGLAVAWVVETVDAPGIPPERREALLHKALELDPASGAAQARLCRVFADRHDLVTLRRCLKEGLAGKRDVPGALVERLRRELAEHDARAARLASTDPEDWRALLRDHPTSPEGN